MRSYLVPLLACAPALLCARDIPQHGPDSRPQAGVPQGEITKKTFASSQIFPGTTRDYWVYVPKQYAADKAANLMVVMDGGGAIKPEGSQRVPLVLDNLIARGEIPVTVGVFINPGVIPAGKPGTAARSNRSFEYDSLGDRYARFLEEELLPEALAGLNVTKDPAGRMACGVSSGGICAFTLAWERPALFGRVVSGIGSFTNIRRGYVYPAEVRKTKGAPKPIRVWLQEGESDLNNLFGNWPLSNEDLAAALKFAGYEHHLEMTGGGHSGAGLGALLPEAIRWSFGASKKE